MTAEELNKAIDGVIQYIEHEISVEEQNIKESDQLLTNEFRKGKVWMARDIINGILIATGRKPTLEEMARGMPKDRGGRETKTDGG